MDRGKHPDSHEDIRSPLLSWLARAVHTEYESSGVGVAILNRDCKYIYINVTLADYHGRSVDEHKGKHITEVLPPSILQVVAPLYKYVITTGLPIKRVDFLTRTDASALLTSCWSASFTPLPTGLLVSVLRMSESASASSEPNVNVLSKSEHIVLGLISRGLSTKEIATKLRISTLTVATHRKNICRKLDLHSASELVAFAANNIHDFVQPYKRH
jgi:DNA-binding CsgD family transcriptional regulator